MTLSGETFTSYLRTNVLPVAEETIFFNNVMLDGSIFEVVPPASCPGGDSIDWIIDEAVSTHAAAYTVGDAMPVADTTTTVVPYVTKDMFQATAKTYDIYRAYQANGGAYSPLGDQDTKSIQMAAKSLRDLCVTTMITDLIALVDSTSAFGDGSLSRSTYPGLVSYEAGSIGTLAKADLDTAIENLLGVTYGPCNLDDLVWLMPVNQLFNLSDVAGIGIQYNEWSTTSNPAGGGIDLEATHRMKSYGGIPIVVVPDMTTTNILLLNRKKVKVFNWMELEITPKDVAAAEQAWLLKFGANVVVLNPRTQAKLDGISA
jgi:hypothetical protein